MRDGLDLAPGRSYSLVLVAAILASASFVGSYFYFNSGRQSATVEASVVRVKLAGDKAIPDSLAVKVGQSVSFDTGDNQRHAIGFGRGGAHHQETADYSTAEFGPGQSWLVKFKQKGVFELHDHEQPLINVLVVVY